MGRKIMIGVTVGIVLLLGLTLWLFWPRASDPVDNAKVVEDFNRSTTTVTGSTGTSPSAHPVPASGVYVYEAKGSETSGFGPLPPQTDELPAEITGVVDDVDDACFTFTLNLFAQHTEDSDFCTGADGTFALRTYAKHQTIGKLTATAKVTCDPGPFIPARGDHAELTCTMKIEGGPFTFESEFDGTTDVGKTTTLEIGGTDVEVTPVTISFDFSDKIGGSWTEKMWFTADHLPVRIERSLKMGGPASSTEDYELQLGSLRPRS